MNTLTIEQIDNELIKLMKEQPDFTYSDGMYRGCNYTKGPSNDPDKCDGCIFGQAFQRLGMTKEKIDDDLENEYILITTAKWLPENKPKYWSEIQEAQDNGEAWGTLLKFMPNA